MRGEERRGERGEERKGGERGEERRREEGRGGGNKKDVNNSTAVRDILSAKPPCTLYMSLPDQELAWRILLPL